MFSDRWLELSNQIPNGVNLLAVSKGHSASSIRQLAKLGQFEFGESRVQEALPKLEALDDLIDLRWHFIGRLQSNKVRTVVRAFDMIHSVDSLTLAERISRIAGEEERCPAVFLQVKFRDDPTKSGISRKETVKVFSSVIDLPNLNLVGLMAMAPLGLSLDERKVMFEECRELADCLRLPECSMGMSQDWPQAVEAGSTWLRLGSAVFGERKK